MSEMQERDSWGPLPSPAEAWARVATRWQAPHLATEQVALLEALDRVVAREVVSPLDSPPFDRSAMDGYAVRSTDLPEGPDRPELTTAGEVPMGTAATAMLGPGQAIWVATGSMIPPGADAVVNVERTEVTAGRLRIVGPVPPGDNIVTRAADLAQGDVVLRPGRRLRPQDVAVLASLGYPTVEVVRRPRVAILLTGDELRAPGQPLAPGQIYNSNGYALAAQALRLGGQPHIAETIPDDLAAVTNALRSAVAQAELVLISGGSSVGVKDLTVQALEALSGAEVLVHGVATRPGRPTILATVSDCLVIGIPGNPVSAMVSFAMFGQPALQRLLRLSAEELAVPRGGAVVQARLEGEITSKHGRQDYARVALRAEAGAWLARPVLGASSILTSMVFADGLVTVPPNAERLRPGDEVTVTTF